MKKRIFSIILTLFIVISLIIFLFFLLSNKEKNSPQLIKHIKDIKSHKSQKKVKIQNNVKKQIKGEDFTQITKDTCLFGNNEFSSRNKKLCQKQNNFNEALVEFYKLLQKINQRSFLCRSLALGAAREKHFITHDYDIDIGIFYDDYKSNGINLYEHIKKVGKNKFRVADIFGKLDKSYEFFVYYKKYNIRIDIIFFYKNEQGYYHSLHNGLCKQKPGGFCKMGYTLFELRKYEFMGNYYFIPHRLETYLIESYGKDWTVIKNYKYWTGLNKEFKNIIN
jgi:hypothetical protein